MKHGPSRHVSPQPTELGDASKIGSLPARILAAAVAALMLSLATGAVLKAADQLKAGANVNMVGGPASIDVVANQVLKILGDPYLQRQNEPSVACSTFDPQMCLAASNDTRLVNAPGLPEGKVTGDSWLGIYWTNNGGKNWRSTMLPGFLQDGSAVGATSPIKGKEAAADPTVRVGSDGLFYVSGIAFNRADVSTTASAGVEAKKGVAFIAVYKDPQNANLEPIYLGTKIVDSGASGQFLDKPWIAVDIPRGTATCGTVYYASSVFTGQGTNNQSKLLVSKSTDCGQTWGTPSKISEGFAINQSANLAIHPLTGEVLATWRVFGTQNLSVPSQILFSKSSNGKTWTKPTVIRSLGLSNASLAPDQGTLPSPDSPLFRMFRTNAYPSMCVTTDGIIRIVFPERKGGDPNGDARIQVAKFAGGSWTVTAVDDHPGRGNQFMPAIACSGRSATAAWYDQRRDSAAAAFGDHLFGPFIFDLIPPPPTHTLDIRAARTDKATGLFSPDTSTQVSRYRFGLLFGILAQLEYNAVDWPLFGKFPFIGDYIDASPDRTMVLGANGWRFFGTNSNGTENAAEATESVIVHLAWGDNRDVIPSYLQSSQPDPNAAGQEPDGSWVTRDPSTGQELQENWNAPGTTQCSALIPTANKNQNVYTATVSDGLLVGALDQTRDLGDVWAYAVYIANTTSATRRFTLTTDTLNASFSFSNPNQTSVTIDIPARETRGATVFVPGVTNLPRTTVTVTEIDLALPSPYTFLALKRSVVVNPTPGTVDTESHDVSLLVNALGVTTIDNPIFDPENPIFDPENPIFDPENPIWDPENPIWDPENPIFDPENPIWDPENPIWDPENPIFDPENPIFDPENPIFDPENTSPEVDTVYEQSKVTQLESAIINEGNVASAYDINMLISSLPTDLIWQLVVMRVATQPASAVTASQDNCEVQNAPHMEAVTKITSQDDANVNTSVVLSSGERAYLLLRLYHDENFTFNPQTLALTVTAQADPLATAVFGNRAPVATDIADTTEEDTPRDITLSGSDIDGDPLSYTIVDEPAHGTLSVSGADVTYTPNQDYSGPDSFTFKANDGAVDSDPATVSLTVTAVNDAPVAIDQAAATNEDVPTAITLAASDVDSAALSYIFTGPSHGTLSGVAPNLTYTPAQNYSGPDSFTFTANDGEANSNPATVSISVGALNDAPVAIDATVSLPEGTSAGITLTGTDVDSPSLSFSIVTGPSSGGLSGVLPNLTYTPTNIDFFGADSFTFKVFDGGLYSGVATVSIAVTPVNDAPVANNDASSATSGGAVVISVVSNDTDVDNLASTLTVAAITESPLHGTAVISGGGTTITYTSNETFAGVDTFKYTVKDPLGATSPSPATVTVSTTYGFNGLLAPYQVPPGKKWNVGQSVPLVWQYTNANNFAVDSSGVAPMLYVTFTKLTGANPNNCSGGTETSTVLINKDSPGNSFFQYFTAANPHQTAGANTWQFNWQTSAPVTDGCWKGRVILDLNGNGNALTGSGIGDAGDQVNKAAGFLFLLKP